MIASAEGTIKSFLSGERSGFLLELAPDLVQEVHSETAGLRVGDSVIVTGGPGPRGGPFLASTTERLLLDGTRLEVPIRSNSAASERAEQLSALCDSPSNRATLVAALLDERAIVRDAAARRLQSLDARWLRSEAFEVRAFLEAIEDRERAMDVRLAALHWASRPPVPASAVAALIRAHRACTYDELPLMAQLEELLDEIAPDRDRV